MNERASKASIKAQRKSKDPNVYLEAGIEYVQNPDNVKKYNLRMNEMINARNNYIQESEKFINNLLGDYAKIPSQNSNTSLGNLMRGAMYDKLRRGFNV